MPVDHVTPDISDLVDDMVFTMYEANGIGLAAVQVDRPLQIVVVDTSESKDSPQVYINPLIEESSGLQTTEEGCLSIPGFFEEVERAEVIQVTALDRNGESFTRELGGLDSVCVQHEIDHLNGKVFVDYLSRVKRSRIRKKLLKAKAA
ncbi:MAG: peptide deformylase [Gammaproteobacteria bacterium]|nr:peptide deformylase [Gammaproteobacteria bacterium]MYD80795.1 peptide deformylase [Gammaproteobacteria bacterium]